MVLGRHRLELASGPRLSWRLERRGVFAEDTELFVCGGSRGCLRGEFSELTSWALCVVCACTWCQRWKDQELKVYNQAEGQGDEVCLGGRVSWLSLVSSEG